MPFRPQALLLLLSALLASCGWHLKGNLQPEADIDSLYFESQLANYQRGPDSIEHSLKRRLEQIGIALTNTPSDTQMGLTLISEDRSETVLSLTSDLFEQQIRLEKAVTYGVSRGDERLVVRNQISAFRDMSADQSSAAAKNREADLIFNEINRDLADQMILHLQRLAAVDNANPG